METFRLDTGLCLHIQQFDFAGDIPPVAAESAIGAGKDSAPYRHGDGAAKGPFCARQRCGCGIAPWGNAASALLRVPTSWRRA